MFTRLQHCRIVHHAGLIQKGSPFRIIRNLSTASIDVSQSLSASPVHNLLLRNAATDALSMCPKPLPKTLVSDLRSDHAGETGAVYIYKGAIVGTNLRSQLLPSSIIPQDMQHKVSDFLNNHMETEKKHLEAMEVLVPEAGRTRLIPIWKVSGFTLGFLPALIGGPRALFRTIAAVETFVEDHYLEQIQYLEKEIQSGEEGYAPLLNLLKTCCADEVHHRDDSLDRLLGEPPGLMSQIWSVIVGKGSATAVWIARMV